MPPAPTREAGHVPSIVEHLFRHQAGRITAALARTLGAGQLDLVEDVVQDALVQALRTWPFHGIPDDPAAWLFRTARNRALDVVRRSARLRDREPAIAAALAGDAAPRAESAGADTALGDDELALLFACCHPAIPREAGVALALRTVGGLGVEEIAGAFLAEPATIAQRLVRAKRRLREAGVQLALPGTLEELDARVPAVLAVIYLVFNEGYGATEGDALVRRELCAEALRLALLVARHPRLSRPDAHALVALVALHAARLPARVADGGDPVLLAAQDPARWDAGLIALGFRHLEAAARGDALTRYHVEARIASLHALAAHTGRTDWPAVLAAYDTLLAVAPSPAARVHRAVAVGMVHGARAALAALADAASPPGDAGALERYVWYHTTRAHWHAAAGEVAAARAAYGRALEVTEAAPVRRFVEGRLGELGEDRELPD